MHVLMIGLDFSLLGDPHGDTVQRHLEYARRIGSISTVVYNPAAQPKLVQHFAENYTVYPTNTYPLLFPWAAYRTAAYIHRKHPVDVVTTQDPFACGLVGLLLKWRFGLPLNMQSHSTFFTNPDWIREHPIRNRLLRGLGKFLVRRADTHRVLTDYEKNVYRSLGIAEERLFVVSVPVPLDPFARPVPDEQRAAIRRNLHIEPDAPLAIWVGLPVAFKHIDLLLDAFDLVHADLPAARLVMVGDFTNYPSYKQRANPDVIYFAGRIPHEHLPAYYAAADIYTHSSRYEGVPRVLIEALAAGKPVVSTRHIGSSAVVQDGKTGLLCDHTPRALADAILALLRNPERAREMGQAGREDVLTRFDSERLISAIVDTYRQTKDFQ